MSHDANRLEARGYCARNDSGVRRLWAADRGLHADDATLTILRKRIGACLKTCENQGLAEGAGTTADHGEFGPYKLWQVVKGGE